MIRRCTVMLRVPSFVAAPAYVKPAQGYINQLPRRHRKIDTFAHIGALGDAVPRRAPLDPGAAEDATAAAAVETAATMEHNWGSDSVETVGVNEETYAKWYCEKFDMTREQYEANGAPQQPTKDDAALLSELEMSAPGDVVDEVLNKKAHERFLPFTLQGDGGEPEENAGAGGAVAEDVASEAVQITSSSSQ